MKTVLKVLSLIVVALFLYFAAGENPEASPVLRSMVIESGNLDTGAVNLVTSIYLGYRAYDTLGETIVLLLAVSGVIVFVERKS